MLTTASHTPGQGFELEREPGFVRDFYKIICPTPHLTPALGEVGLSNVSVWWPWHPQGVMETYPAATLLFPRHSGPWRAGRRSREHSPHDRPSGR